uniref:ATP synthase complex subunit 8 n=1 Tax=Aconurella prolixa TaxID=1671185 RepID=A0A8F8FE26_9HEMI
MPQMAPTWWTIIMMLSIVTMIITMTMVYFLFTYTNKIIKNNKTKKFDWK